jgi:preprotein translocase subunit SecE
MPTKEDEKKSAEDELSSHLAAEAPIEEPASSDEEAEEEEEAEAEGRTAASSTLLGTRRWVYAAYFAGAIGVAFIVEKALSFAWLKASAWKPALGEPRDEILMPVAALCGIAAALYYWNRTRARQLAEEVAGELSKVTWPSRQDVTNSTFVVIVTTVVATVFFALMDRFWGFVTNLVYGT